MILEIAEPGGPLDARGKRGGANAASSLAAQVTLIVQMSSLCPWIHKEYWPLCLQRVVFCQLGNRILGKPVGRISSSYLPFDVRASHHGCWGRQRAKPAKLRPRAPCRTATEAAVSIDTRLNWLRRFLASCYSYQSQQAGCE